MGIDTLRFDQVRADDPAVSDEEYVEVPRATLPIIQATGPAHWWNTQSGESIWE